MLYTDLKKSVNFGSLLNKKIKINSQDIYDIIIQLIRANNIFGDAMKYVPVSDDEIRTLVPIDRVYKGYIGYIKLDDEDKNLYENKKQKITFKPDSKYGEGLELEVDLSDEEDRLAKYEEINEQIRIYNTWCNDHKGVPVGEYQPWLFYVGKAETLHGKRIDVNDSMWQINHKELYRLKEELPESEFVARFNQSIFDYIQKEIVEAEKLKAWNDDNMWYQPNIEFVNWFQKHGFNIDEATPIFQDSIIEKEKNPKIYKAKRNQEIIDKADARRGQTPISKVYEDIADDYLEISHHQVKKIVQAPDSKPSRLKKDIIKKQ